MHVRYLNTDFCVSSPRAFDLLAGELEGTCDLDHYGAAAGVGFELMAHAKGSGGPNLARDPQLDIEAILVAVNELSPTAASQLASCASRSVNVGYQSAEVRPERAFRVRAELLQAMSSDSIDLEVTIHPPSAARP